MNQPISRHAGKIRVSYRMFVISAQTEALDEYDRRDAAGMLNARAGVLGVSSSVDSYPSVTWLTLERWSSAPVLEDLDRWDAAAELTYSFATPATLAETFVAPELSTMDHELAEVLIPAGTYRFRAYARKEGTVVIARPQEHIDRDPTFDDNDELIVEDRLEDTLIQYWPTEATDSGDPHELKAHEEYPSW